MRVRVSCLSYLDRIHDSLTSSMGFVLKKGLLETKKRYRCDCVSQKITTRIRQGKRKWKKGQLVRMSTPDGMDRIWIKTYERDRSRPIVSRQQKLILASETTESYDDPQRKFRPRKRRGARLSCASPMATRGPKRSQNRDRQTDR